MRLPVGDHDRRRDRLSPPETEGPNFGGFAGIHEPTVDQYRSVLTRVQGTLAALAGFAALDPRCALNAESITAMGRRMSPTGL